MKFGVNIPPFTDARTIIEWARTAEEAGWDGVFLWDHIQWNPGVAPLDPWVLLGAMALVTQRVRLGTLVTPLSRRRPQVVAKQLTTLDHLSNGRAVLGVGLGDPVDRDFADLGEEADARTRARMLDEALTVIDQLLQGPTDFRGDHYSIKADFYPRPVQRPRPPIWVAGILPNRKPLERALRWDGIVPLGTEGTSTPSDVAAYLNRAPHPRPDGWEVITSRLPGFSVQEYAAAGVTWLIDPIWPNAPGWEDATSRLVRTSPELA